MAGNVEPSVWARALRDHGPADSTVRLVLLVLRTYMNREGEAYPSQETIASGAALAKFTVTKAIARAEDAGWIARYERPGNVKPQAWRRHGYRAVVPEDVDLAPYLRSSESQEGGNAEWPPSRGRRSVVHADRRAVGEADRRFKAKVAAAFEFLDRTEPEPEKAGTQDARLNAEVGTPRAEAGHPESGSWPLSATKVATQSGLKSSSEVTYEAGWEGHARTRGLPARDERAHRDAKNGSPKRTGDEAASAIAKLLASSPGMNADEIARIARCELADVTRYLQAHATAAPTPRVVQHEEIS